MISCCMRKFILLCTLQSFSLEESKVVAFMSLLTDLVNDEENQDKPKNEVGFLSYEFYIIRAK